MTEIPRALGAQDSPAPGASASFGLPSFIKRQPVTLLLIAAIIGFAALGRFEFSMAAAEPWLLIRGKLPRELWRLLAVHLVSPSVLGFAISLFVDWSFARQLEAALGSVGLLLVILGSAVFGSAVELLIQPQAQVLWVHSLFMGFVGALLGYIAVDRGSIRAFFKDKAVLNYAFFLALMVAIDLKLAGGIQWGRWAGLLSGFLIGAPWTWTRWSEDGELRRGRWLAGVSMMLIAGVAFAALLPERFAMIRAGVVSSLEPEEDALNHLDLRPFASRYQPLAARLKDPAADSRRRAGAAMLLAGERDAALDALEDAVKSLPRDGLSWALLARANLADDNRREARENFERAADYFSRDSAPSALLFWRGFLERSEQRRKDFLTEFLKRSAKEAKLAELKQEAEKLLKE